MGEGMDGDGRDVGGVEFDFGVCEEDGTHGAGAEGSMTSDAV